jgi:hypothetical protein
MMRFFTYRPQRQVALATPGIPEQHRNWLASLSNAEYATQGRQNSLNRYAELKKTGRLDAEGLPRPGDSHAAEVITLARECCAEVAWHDVSRPFYNVFPVVADMVSGVKLSLTFEQVSLPFPAMLFLFSESTPPTLHVGRLRKRLESVLWYSGPDPTSHDPSDKVWIAIAQFEGNVVPCWSVSFNDPTLEIEESLRSQFRCTAHEVNAQDRRLGRNTQSDMLSAIEAGNSALGTPLIATTVYDDAFEWCFRLLVLTSLLAAGNDLVTPVLLAKDQKHLESVSSHEIDEWIAMRAAKARSRGVLGFDVGRSLQAEKDRTPHFRNPHLALYHTGPGGREPRVQLRRGAVVVSKAFTRIPTGFLGPETPEEIEACNRVPCREPISLRTRFYILKRDEYRCQICGAAPSLNPTTQLHIDHKMPVAAGGTSDISNLWVLCSQCNLGKGVNSL